MDGQGLSPNLREWFRSNQQVALTLGSGGPSNDYEATRVDVLVPPFDSAARRLTLRAAIVIFVVTVCADGETLWGTAHAMRVCGVVPTLFGLSLGALLSERALYLLTATARRGGVISYGEAFGQTAEYITAGLLHVYLLRMILFHLVAVRDLIAPLVTSNTKFDVGRGNGLLFFITIFFVIPSTILSRDMYNLRHLAYAASVCLAVVLLATSLLAVVSMTTTAQTRDETNTIPIPVRLESDLDGTIYDILTTFPTTLLSFVSSFIVVLPLHAPLEQPTYGRVRTFIRQGIIWSWITLVVFGVGTKIFGNDAGSRSVLSMVDGSYTQGWQRVSCGLSSTVRIMASLAILCSTSIIVHPCRANILECIQRHLSNGDNCCVPGDICHDLHEKCPDECLKDEIETADTTVPSYTSQSTTPRINNVTFLPFTTSPAADVDRPRLPFNSVQLAGRTDTVSEVTPLMSVDEDSPSPDNHSPSSDNNSPPYYTTTRDPDETMREMEARTTDNNGTHFPPCNIDSNRPIRVTCSVFIILLCYLLAFAVAPMPSEMTILATRGAANVWNLAKSSVGVMISFVLPVACFLRLHMFNRRHEMDLWSTLAWFLLLLVSPIFLLVWAPGWLAAGIQSD